MNLTIALAFSLTFAFGACMLLAAVFSGTIINIDNSVLPSQITAVYAQTTDHIIHTPTSSNSEDLDTTLQNSTTSTFSATGPISSLVITVPESDFNITNAFKVVLTGMWNLSVNNGNVTHFAVRFIASPMDGSRPHVHQITDFRPYNNEKSITLTEDNSLSVNGTADFKINDTVVWENGDVSISISKGNIFIFDPDDVDTDSHFGDQQVYGIVARLIT
jgi:hypothetical protein